MTETARDLAPRIGSEDRNPYIDWVRAGSVCVVVIFHTRLFAVTQTDGRLLLEMWAPPSYLWILTWLLMVIPVFFISGGYGHSVNMVKAARLHTGYGQFLANRARKLAGPTATFVGFWAVLASLLAAVIGTETVADLTRSGMALLWFIMVYLGVTMMAPAMVWAHVRFGGWVFAVLILLAVGVDMVSFVTGMVDLRYLNFGPVWLFAHQLGIAYHRGWFRTWRVRWLVVAILAMVIGVIGLITVAGYPPVGVGLGDVPIGNVQPPTSAMILVAVAQVSALALFERAAPRWAGAPRTRKPVATVNALLMTIYLWHVPCIVVINAILWMTGVAPMLPDFVLRLSTTLLSLGLVAAVVPAIARVDLALVPAMGTHPSTVKAVVATVGLIAGVAVVWATGVVVSVDTPWSTLGVALVAAGWFTMRWATRSRADI